MQGARRLASFEQRLSAAAVAIGRALTRGVGVLPRIVRRASGIDDPSPEAVAAGVVRGVTALAPLALGGPFGRCVDAAGAATVLALVTWNVRAEAEDGEYEVAIERAIAHAADRGLCGARTAWLWRTVVGLAPPIEGNLLKQAALSMSSAAAIAGVKAVVGRALGPRAVGLRVIGVGLCVLDAWTAMGDAARLVESTRCLAAEDSAAPESGVVVMAVPARAA